MLTTIILIITLLFRVSTLPEYVADSIPVRERDQPPERTPCGCGGNHDYRHQPDSFVEAVRLQHGTHLLTIPHRLHAERALNTPAQPAHNSTSQTVADKVSKSLRNVITRPLRQLKRIGKFASVLARCHIFTPRHSYHIRTIYGSSTVSISRADSLSDGDGGFRHGACVECHMRGGWCAGWYQKANICPLTGVKKSSRKARQQSDAGSYLRRVSITRPHLPSQGTATVLVSFIGDSAPQEYRLSCLARGPPMHCSQRNSFH